jgi:hypothetical protein
MDIIEKLFTLMGIDFHAIAIFMLDSFIENLKQMPDAYVIPKEFWEKKRNNIDFRELKKGYIEVYAQRYTLEEISQLIKFYESPIGKKSLIANQKITQEIQENMQIFFEKLGEEVANEIFEEYDL